MKAIKWIAVITVILFSCAFILFAQQTDKKPDEKIAKKDTKCTHFLDREDLAVLEALKDLKIELKGLEVLDALSDMHFNFDFDMEDFHIEIPDFDFNWEDFDLDIPEFDFNWEDFTIDIDLSDFDYDFDFNWDWDNDISNKDKTKIKKTEKLK